MRISAFLLLTFFLCTPLNGLADDTPQQGWQDQGPELILTPDTSDSSAQFQDEPISASAPEEISMSPVDSSTFKAQKTSHKMYSVTAANNLKVKPRVYGPTTHSEHIWEVAQKLRPNDSVTVQQMMIALLRNNPDAFSEKNINSLKIGSLLRIPTLAKVQEISSEQAHQLVLTQNQQWKKSQSNFKDKSVYKVSNVTLLPVVTQAAKITLLPDPNQFTPVNNNAAATPAITVPATAVNSTENLQREITTTEQELQNYKNQMNTQIQDLEKQNAALQVSLLKDEKIINQLTQKNQLNLNSQSASPLLPNQLSAYLPKSKVGWWIMWAMLFLIVLIWMPSEKRQPKQRQEPIVIPNNAPIVTPEEPKADPKFDDDYDFMNSKEALPAKLDLARAYIDMDDYSSAEILLKEILEKGSSTERKKATQLLKTIKVPA